MDRTKARSVIWKSGKLCPFALNIYVLTKIRFGIGNRMTLLTTLVMINTVVSTAIAINATVPESLSTECGDTSSGFD